jgi:hypothetical protein
MDAQRPGEESRGGCCGDKSETEQRDDALRSDMPNRGRCGRAKRKRPRTRIAIIEAVCRTEPLRGPRTFSDAPGSRVEVRTEKAIVPLGRQSYLAAKVKPQASSNFLAERRSVYPEGWQTRPALGRKDRREEDGTLATQASTGCPTIMPPLRCLRPSREAIVLVENAHGIAAFAVCHYGPRSEAGADTCFVKFGAVRDGQSAEYDYLRLLDACEALTVAAGMSNLLAGANMARHEAYRHLVSRGFRTEMLGVTMHKQNDPGYCRPGSYIIDDWR